jgi:hypothetical protein
MCDKLFPKYLDPKTVLIYRPHPVCTYKEYHSVCPSSELGIPPTPHPQASVPLPPVSGGRGTLAGEKGVGRVPIPTRGVHCGTLYMYVLCAMATDQPETTSTINDPNFNGLRIICSIHQQILVDVYCRT